MQLNSTEIAELIKSRIEKFDVVSEARNEGTIVSVTDGIIRINGLADFVRRQDLRSCSECGGGLGHAVYDTRIFILGNGIPVAVVQRKETFSTIAAHPGKQHR